MKQKPPFKMGDLITVVIKEDSWELGELFKITPGMAEVWAHELGWVYSENWNSNYTPTWVCCNSSWGHAIQDGICQFCGQDVHAQEKKYRELTVPKR